MGEQVSSFLDQYHGKAYSARFRSRIGTVDRSRFLGSNAPTDAGGRLGPSTPTLHELMKEVGEDLIGL